MKIDLTKTWLSSYNFVKEHPIVLMPFIVVSFLECLILETAYFCTRKPLLVVFGPIVRKFFGEQFMHYPENLVLMPRLFNFGQIALYILVSVFLTGIAVQIFLSIKNGTPVIFKAVVKITAKKYMSLFCYGLTYIIVTLLLQKFETFFFLKTTRFISRHLFIMPAELVLIGLSLFSFFAFIVINTLLILTIPVIIIEGKWFIGAILRSVSLGVRNFIKLFCLLLLPFIFYLPILIIKAFLVQIMDKTFPGISLYIMAAGSIVTIFLDSFAIICVSQFLLGNKKDLAGKTA